MRTLLGAVLASLCLGHGRPAAAQDAPRSGELMRHVRVLAHDSMGGRLTPSPGLERAARYVADRFREAGLRPAGDGESFLQRFEILTTRLDPDRAGIHYLTSAGGRTDSVPDLRLGCELQLVWNHGIPWGPVAVLTGRTFLPERIDGLEEIREHLPIFDSRVTPTSMGAIPETFRNWPGTERSDHPLESVCARGPAASQITSEHPLAFSEGPGGPFEKLYDLDSRILLIGVGFNRCTALHYAESLVEKRRLTTVRFPAMEDGRRVWREVPNVADDNDTHFPVIGERYLSGRRAELVRVGEASSTLVSTRDLVDFAVAYLEEEL